MEITDLAQITNPELKKATDQLIGANYYTLSQIHELKEKSLSNGINCSFALIDKDKQVKGFRIAFAPNKWNQEFSNNKISPDKWKIPLKDVGYFKSLFIHPSYQQQGWSKKLNEKTLDAFKKLHTKAILTHCWKESPNNSSFKYLDKNGFEVITEHKLFWAEIDYDCALCKKPPCQCTALEMIKYI